MVSVQRKGRVHLSDPDLAGRGSASTVTTRTASDAKRWAD